MNDRAVLTLTAPKLASYLRIIADKLDRAGNFELEYHDNFFWEFSAGVATSKTEPSKPCFELAAASDSGDYFLTGFDEKDDAMLAADLWKLADLLRYYDLTLGSKGAGNGN